MKRPCSKIFVSFVAFVLFSNLLFSYGPSKVDSLLKVLSNTKEDTLRLKTLLSLCEECKVEDNLKYVNSAIKLSDKLFSSTNDVELKKKIIAQKSKLYDPLKIYFGSYPERSDFMLDFCQSLMLNYKELHDSTGIVLTKLNISIFYSTRLDFKKAFDMCQEALELAKKIDYRHGIAKCLVFKSYLYKDQGDLQQALVNIEQALITYKEVHDSEKVSDVLKRKGSIYSELKDLNKAVACYQEAISLNKEMKSSEGLRAAYNQLGLVYLDNNYLDNALKNFMIALPYAEQLSDKTWMRGILGNIGDVYRAQGNTTKAIEYHTKALNSIIDLKIEIQEAWVNWQFAEDYMQIKNYKIAKTYNDKFLEAVKRHNNIGEIERGEKRAALIDSALGNYKGALEHFKQHIYWKDKLNSEEIKKQAIKEKFQTEYQEQRKRDELLQSQKDVVIQQQLQKQKIIRNSFISGSILLILLIFVLINRSKLKRTVEMEKMRSRLSRDLHDDIGSTLSSINILSRTAQSNLKYSDDERTKASLEKINERSQRLLDNMSDIIWNINPGNDTIEEVMSRMREYATTILEAKNIDYTFRFPKEKMECTLSMEVKNNVYLIFKEAINNLSKYSSATNANLSLTFDEKHIHLKIEDNGKGFDIDQVIHRGGLINMQHRAEEIKGKIKISSEIGKGTVLELTMPRFC